MAKESLVRRVCNEDKSLASSGIQVTLVEKLGEKIEQTTSNDKQFYLIDCDLNILKTKIGLQPIHVIQGDHEPEAQEYQQVPEVGG